MTFHDFLDQYAKRGETAALVLARLLKHGRMPAETDGWPVIRAWLRDVKAPRDELNLVQEAWRAYRRFLIVKGWKALAPEPNPVCTVPGASGVVVDAKPLTRLRDLGHEHRLIARMLDAGNWDWCGDLDDLIERRKYLVMLWDHESVIQFSHFPAPGRRVLFACVRRSFVPAQAYKAAAEPVELSVKQNPRWLTLGQPHVGLGAIR